MLNLGYSLLVATTIMNATALAAYLPGVRRDPATPRLRIARPAVYLTALGLVLTAGWLWYLILNHRFEYSYVFRYSSRDMPLRYVIASFWGGQEGTFLLWALYGGLLALFLRFKARQYEAPVLFFYLGINLFLMLMLLKANPFARLQGTPPEGNGLNPLLQDPWMTIHPPIMFFGFASLGIPAAYAMAALVKEDWDNWVRRAIPWTLFGIMALGTGLTLGGYWAYSILGWGGYWGWDPVENSSLVPWLLAVALLHNQVIQSKRGIFRRSNLFLSMLPFILLTYSTFLTRSGVLADFSVHSFTDLGINQFLVAFMGVFLAGGIGLFIFKYRRIPVEATQAPVLSREYFMFLGALAFGLFGVFVALGTSSPIITKLWGPPGNVQPEFYNKMGLPFAVLLSLLVGSAPHLAWSHGEWGPAWRRCRWPLLAALVLAPVLFLAGLRHLPYLLMVTSGAFAALSNGVVVVRILRERRAAFGGYLAHVGIGLCVVGILTSTTQGEKQTVVFPEGEEVRALGYGFKYMGRHPVEAGRKDAYEVALRTAQGAYVLAPTMFFSDFNAGMMKKPAIKSFLTHDIYLSPIGHALDPIEDRVETQIVLTKETERAVQGLTFRFLGFENSTPEGDETALARLEVSTPAGPVEVRPALCAHADGSTDAVPVDIAGTPYRVRLLGVDPQNERARLGLIPPPVALGKGESAALGGVNVEFLGFDVDMGQREGGSVKVVGHAQVEFEGHQHVVSPTYVSRPGSAEPERIEAPLARTGLNLVLYDVDAQNGKALFYVAAAPQEYLYAEVSTKPFIILLWMGTGLTVLGLGLATVHRARLAGRLAKAGVGSAQVSGNGAREAA